MDVPILGADIIAQTFDGKREERGKKGEGGDSERDEEWRLWLKRVREGGRLRDCLWLLSFTEIETSFIICHEF